MRLGTLAGSVVAAVTVLGVGLPALPAMADATTLYVRNSYCSNTATDAGTQADPFCTVQKAADVAQPGQTVLISPGRYYEQVQLTHSGSPGQPIVFAAASGADRTGLTYPQFTSGDPSNPKQNAGFALAGVHDITITGLTFYSLPGSAITVGSASRITIDQNHVAFTGQASPHTPAIQLTTAASAVTVSHNQIGDTIGAGISVGQGMQDTNVTTNLVSLSQGPGIAVSGTQGTLVTNNTLRSNCGQNIAVGGTSTGTVIENNITDAVLAFNTCAGPAAEISVSAESAPTTTYDYNLVHPSSGVSPYVWAGIAYATAADLHTVTGVAAHDLNSDPQLNGPEVWAPGPESPAIDSADANAPGLPATDLYGRKPVDDPNVPNSGTGNGFRDRGAVELQSFYLKTQALNVTEGPSPLPVTVTVGVGTMWIAPLTYTVDFHDGSQPVSSSTPTIQHVYTAVGYHTPTVTVSDASGFTRAFPLGNSVDVGTPGPIQPKLTLTPMVVGADGSNPNAPALTYTADTAGSTSPYPITGEAVDWGDGSTVQESGHTYRSPGVRTVTVTLTDDHGDTAKISQQLDVEYAPSGFTPLAPSRVMDTRNFPQSGRSWGFGSTYQGHGEKLLKLPVGLSGGLPQGTTAVVLNLTVVSPAHDGFLAVAPDDSVAPASSSLNFTARQTVANLVTAPVGPDGSVYLWTNTDNFDVVADLFGYYNPLSAGKFAAQNPVRLLDTRSDPGAQVIGPDSSVSVQVAGVHGVPADATAAVLNLTATGSTTGGFLTAYPSGTAKPTTSNVNFLAHDTIANQVVVPIGADGKVTIYNHSGNTHAVVDLFGYYSPGGTDLYHPVGPSRLLDTRLGAGTKLGPGVSTGIGIPSGADAAVMNVTSTESDTPGFFTLYPNGIPVPSTSNLNFSARETIPNQVTVPVGKNGQVDLFNFAGHTHAIADLYGYFAKP